MRSLLTIICLVFSINTFASTSIRDSVGVENNNGKQLILHKVAAKESYYSIGRTYHVSPKDIIELNGNKTLQIGSIVKVPTNRPFSASAKPSDNAPAAGSDIITYKVGPKETLFAIARRFSTSVEAIKTLNNLTSNSLSVGQLIKVKSGEASVVTPAPAQEARPAQAQLPDNRTDSSEAGEESRPKIPATRLGLIQRTERGAAVWIEDENLDKSKMLALHSTAPVGTIVKITNPMTDRTTFAKVVGKFTENESTRDAIIVVTKATADTLGALDKRFQVSIDYGAPNE